MASFGREKALIDHLLSQLGLGDAVVNDPNAGTAKEMGVDVRIRLADGQTIGVQVTEIDPHAVRGSMRGQEKALAGAAPDKPYFMWGQNDYSVVLGAIAGTIERKVGIADRHSFNGYNEVWWLLCAGIPENGAAVRRRSSRGMS